MYEKCIYKYTYEKMYTNIRMKNVYTNIRMKNVYTNIRMKNAPHMKMCIRMKMRIQICVGKMHQI